MNIRPSCHLLAAILGGLFSSLGCIQAVYADLGQADQPKNLIFDAWCGKIKNSCKVTFSGDRMSVNGGQGIVAGQATRIWLDHELRGFWDRTPGNYYYPVYYISYNREDGTNGTAKFIFINEKAGNSFWAALQGFTRQRDPDETAKRRANDALEQGSADRFGTMMMQQTPAPQQQRGVSCTGLSSQVGGLTSTNVTCY